MHAVLVGLVVLWVTILRMEFRSGSVTKLQMVLVNIQQLKLPRSETKYCQL